MAEETGVDEEILKLLDADPFVPFIIILSSGDRYQVNDPHRVALGSNVIYVVQPREGICFFRRTQVIGVEQLSAA